MDCVELLDPKAAGIALWEDNPACVWAHLLTPLEREQDCACSWTLVVFHLFIIKRFIN